MYRAFKIKGIQDAVVTATLPCPNSSVSEKVSVVFEAEKVETLVKGKYLRLDQLASEDSIRVHIEVGPRSTAGRINLTAQPPFGNILTGTLRQIIRGSDVVDTKFVLFSKRTSLTNPKPEYRAAEPRPVYANSALLASASDYFQTCEAINAGGVRAF